MKKKESRLISFLNGQRDNYSAQKRKDDDYLEESFNTYNYETSSAFAKKQKEYLKDGNITTNPFYDYAKNYLKEKPKADPAKKRWEDVATISSLSNLMKAVGRGVSAASGAKVAPINKDVFNTSMKYIDKYNDIERNELNRYNEGLTRIALHGESRSDKAAENYLKSLEKERERNERRLLETQRETSRALESEERQNRSSVEKERDREYKRIRDSIIQGTKKEQTKNKTESQNRSPKVVSFVKDKNNKSMPIYEDTMTEIYRLANYEGLLEPYRTEKGAQAKKYQLNIAIDKLFDKYGIDSVMSGKAHKEMKRQNYPYLFNTAKTIK